MAKERKQQRNLFLGEKKARCLKDQAQYQRDPGKKRKIGEITMAARRNPATPD